MVPPNITDSLDRSHVAPEPQPDWPEAIQSWGLAWKIHIYGFGALYIVLFLSTVYFMIKLRKRLLPQPYVLGIAAMTVLMSLCRIVYLLVDPYQSCDFLPPLLVRMLNSLVYPCLVSMFTLLHVIIVQITKMNPNKTSAVKKHRMLCISISSYFLCTAAITTTVSLNVRLKFLLLFSQGVFISWGLVVCFSFVYNGFKVSQFTSEANRALKEFTLYTKIRKEAIRSGKPRDLALHRVTKPRMRDEAEMMPMELEPSCESAGDSSDSMSFFNDAFGENEKCQIVIRSNEAGWDEGHVANAKDESAQVGKRNGSLVANAPGHPTRESDSNWESDGRSDSPSPSAHADSDRQHSAKRYKSSSTRRRPRRDPSRDEPVSSHQHRYLIRKKPLSVLASYFKTNGVLHAKEPSVCPWQSTETLFCHTNRAFDVGSCQSNINNLEADPIAENIPFVEVANDLSTTDTVHAGTHNDPLPTVSQQVDAGDGGYMADTEPNSPKPKPCKTRRGRPKPPSSLPLDVESQQGSPRHVPYPLPLNDGSMGLYRILQGRILSQVHKFVYIATLFVFITCVMKLYAMFGVYGVLTKDTEAEVWPWFVFNTCARYTIHVFLFQITLDSHRTYFHI